jgi:glycosyltransferase involved in cell wall biosynthesis
MNLLFLSTENPFPVDHGHHIRTLQNLEVLAKRYRVHFFGFAAAPQSPEYLEPLEKLCESVTFFPLPVHNRSPKMALLVLQSWFSKIPVSIAKYTSKEMQKSIARLISEKDIKLVHFDLLHMTGYLPKLGNLPTVLVNHNVEWMRVQRLAEVTANPILRQLLLREASLLRRWEKQVCETVGLCIAVSDVDEKMLREQAPEGHYATIPNGVDSAFFAPLPEVAADSNAMIWTGGMDGLYNSDAVDYFLDEIWPVIVEHHPLAQFEVVGKSPTVKLQTMAKTDPRLVIHGYVDDVRPLVAAASFVVAPLRAGSGTKLKVLNAMAQGKAVLTTPVGAEGIAAKPDEAIIIADTAEQFALKAIWLLKNPDIAQKIGANARKVIEAIYDFSVLEAKTLQLYEDLIHKKELKKTLTDHPF